MEYKIFNFLRHFERKKNPVPQIIIRTESRRMIVLLGFNVVLGQ